MGTRTGGCISPVKFGRPQRSRCMAGLIWRLRWRSAPATGDDDIHAGDGDAAEHYTLDGRDEGGEYAYSELSEQHENTPSESLEDGGTSSDNTDYSNEESAGLDADEESTVIDNYDEDYYLLVWPTKCWQSPVPMKARVRGLGLL